MNLGFSFFLFLVVLMIVTTVATSLYLYFSSFVPFIASYDKGSESCDMLSRKQILSSWLEKSEKNPSSSFWDDFFTQRALYNYGTFVCSEFFYLSCRSIPKKFFSTCWSVCHRFCPILPFLRFANRKLAFSLQKLFGNLKKQ